MVVKEIFIIMQKFKIYMNKIVIAISNIFDCIICILKSDFLRFLFLPREGCRQRPVAWGSWGFG